MVRNQGSQITDLVVGLKTRLRAQYVIAQPQVKVAKNQGRTATRWANLTRPLPNLRKGKNKNYSLVVRLGTMSLGLH